MPRILVNIWGQSWSSSEDLPVSSTWGQIQDLWSSRLTLAGIPIDVQMWYDLDRHQYMMDLEEKVTMDTAYSVERVVLCIRLTPSTTINLTNANVAREKESCFDHAVSDSKSATTPSTGGSASSGSDLGVVTCLPLPLSSMNPFVKGTIEGECTKVARTICEHVCDYLITGHVPRVDPALLSAFEYEIEHTYHMSNLLQLVRKQHSESRPPILSLKSTPTATFMAASTVPALLPWYYQDGERSTDFIPDGRRGGSHTAYAALLHTMFLPKNVREVRNMFDLFRQEYLVLQAHENHVRRLFVTDPKEAEAYFDRHLTTPIWNNVQPEETKKIQADEKSQSSAAATATSAATVTYAVDEKSVSHSSAAATSAATASAAANIVPSMVVDSPLTTHRAWKFREVTCLPLIHGPVNADSFPTELGLPVTRVLHETQFAFHWALLSVGALDGFDFKSNGLCIGGDSLLWCIEPMQALTLSMYTRDQCQYFADTLTYARSGIWKHEPSSSNHPTTAEKQKPTGKSGKREENDDDEDDENDDGDDDDDDDEEDDDEKDYVEDRSHSREYDRMTARPRAKSKFKMSSLPTESTTGPLIGRLDPKANIPHLVRVAMIQALKSVHQADCTEFPGAIPVWNMIDEKTDRCLPWSKRRMQFQRHLQDQQGIRPHPEAIDLFLIHRHSASSVDPSVSDVRDSKENTMVDSVDRAMQSIQALEKHLRAQYPTTTEILFRRSRFFVEVTLPAPAPKLRISLRLYSSIAEVVSTASLSTRAIAMDHIEPISKWFDPPRPLSPLASAVAASSSESKTAAVSTSVSEIKTAVNKMGSKESAGKHGPQIRKDKIKGKGKGTGRMLPFSESEVMQMFEKVIRPKDPPSGGMVPKVPVVYQASKLGHPPSTEVQLKMIEVVPKMTEKVSGKDFAQFSPGNLVSIQYKSHRSSCLNSSMVRVTPPRTDLFRIVTVNQTKRFAKGRGGFSAHMVDAHGKVMTSLLFWFLVKDVESMKLVNVSLVDPAHQTSSNRGWESVSVNHFRKPGHVHLVVEQRFRDSLATQMILVDPSRMHPGYVRELLSMGARGYRIGLPHLHFPTHLAVRHNIRLDSLTPIFDLFWSVTDMVVHSNYTEDDDASKVIPLSSHVGLSCVSRSLDRILKNNICTWHTKLNPITRQWDTCLVGAMISPSIQFLVPSKTRVPARLGGSFFPSTDDFYEIPKYTVVDHGTLETFRSAATNLGPGQGPGAVPDLADSQVFTWTRAASSNSVGTDGSDSLALPEWVDVPALVSSAPSMISATPVGTKPRPTVPFNVPFNHHKISTLTRPGIYDPPMTPPFL